MTQLWIQVLWHKHPSASTTDHQATEEEIFRAGIERGVLTAKGSWFRAEQDAEFTNADDMFFRMTFAAASSDAMEEGVKRFGEALRSVFRLEMNDHGAVNGN